MTGWLISTKATGFLCSGEAKHFQAGAFFYRKDRSGKHLLRDNKTT